MKRKFIDRSNWKRIKKSNNIVIKTYEERFQGYAAACFIEEVHEKLICNLDERQFCLVDDGYVWIQRLPIHKNWSITTMFNENNKIIQWYIDITKQNSIDAKGEPFYDDLYLDVVILPTGEIFLLDEDELQEALDKNIITQSDFDLAYREAKKIMNGIARDVVYLTNMSYEDLEFFKAQLKSENEI